MTGLAIHRQGLAHNIPIARENGGDAPASPPEITHRKESRL